MSVITPAAPDVAASTSTSAPGSELWRRSRIPLALLAVLVVALLALGALRTTARGTLDPRSYSPDGGRAVATLLERSGVPVRVVADLDQLDAELESGSTVFVPPGQGFFAGELGALGQRVDDSGAALVLAGAGAQDLSELDLPLSVAGPADVQTRSPRCDLAYAVRAGSARTGGVAYDARGDGTGCYPSGGSSNGGNPTLLVLPGGRTTLLGASSALTNERLADDGNAALALGLLGERQDGGAPTELLWVVLRPDRPQPAGQPSTLRDLVPESVVWGTVQLAVAVGVLALWRARRLGRVVLEPLPVVVRGAESVEGRARLYRTAGARGQAAEALRAGARDRLARALGLPADSGRPGLVQTLSARAGKDPLQVDALLYGPAPADDNALVRLADDLDGLTP